jgi:hypothetical protein
LSHGSISLSILRAPPPAVPGRDEPKALPL